MKQVSKFEQDTIAEINVFLEGIHLSHSVEMWYALYHYFLDLTFPQFPQDTCHRILNEADVSLENIGDNEEFKIFLVTCVELAVRLTSHPFKYISQTSILPYFSTWLEEGANVTLLNLILQIIGYVCDDVSKNEYGDGVLILEYLQKNLLSIIYNLDIEENTELISDLLDSIMKISKSINQTPARYQILFELLVLLLDSPLDVAEKAVDHLSDLLQRFPDFTAQLKEEDVIRMIEMIQTPSHIAHKSVPLILNSFCQQNQFFEFLMQNELFDKLMTTLQNDLIHHFSVSAGPIFECLYNLCKQDHDLLSMFYQSEIFANWPVSEANHASHKALIKFALLSIEIYNENPPFLHIVDQICQNVLYCLSVEDEEMIIDALMIAEILLEHQVQLDCLEPLDDIVHTNENEMIINRASSILQKFFPNRE